MDRRRRILHNLTFDSRDAADIAYALLDAERRRAPWVIEEIAWIEERWIEEGMAVESHHLSVLIIQPVDARSWETIRLELARVAELSGGRYSGGIDLWPARRRRSRGARGHHTSRRCSTIAHTS